MRLVYVFCLFLLAGMFCSQLFDLSGAHYLIAFLSNLCLAYIMIEVGLEFSFDKKHARHYVWDYVVAATAATVPWLLCFLYFQSVFGGKWQETLLIARFAAPTSSGILFSMLGAAGLATTWFFRKVQVLAILDDLDTIILLVPLQFLLQGTGVNQLLVVSGIIGMLVLAWFCMKRLRLPVGRLWIFGYALVLAILTQWLWLGFDVEIEILLPGFVLGTLLYNPHMSKKYAHEHAYMEPQERPLRTFDRGVKIAFLFLVGLFLPRISLENNSLWFLLGHVVLVTLLMNLGKCFPMLCYRKEASLPVRVSLGIAMFPRGEVGGGILVLALEHGVKASTTLDVAALALSLNLLLTGLFISLVLKLVRGRFV